MSQAIRLPFSPADLKLYHESRAKFEEWVRSEWIESIAMEISDDHYRFPAIEYAYQGWKAGFEAGRAFKSRKFAEDGE